MQRIEKRTEILYDLLHINKDYATECEKIINNIMHEPYVCNLMREMATIGRGCVYELRLRTDTALGDPADVVEVKGEIYKAWLENAGIEFSLKSPEIFSCCEKKIKALSDCYKNALQYGEDFSNDIKSLLRNQLRQINNLEITVSRFNREPAY